MFSMETQQNAINAPLVTGTITVIGSDNDVHDKPTTCPLVYHPPKPSEEMKGELSMRHHFSSAPSPPSKYQR